MAKHLHQLDLFGMETAQPVHIKAPVEKKKVYQAKKEETVNEQVQLVNEDLPSVSRTPMSFIHSHTSSKRGRKSFASMDAEIHKLHNDNKPELIAGDPQGGVLLYRNTSVNVGIENTYKPLDISIYPNPANDYIFIKTNDSEKFSKVQLLDLNGKVVVEINEENSFQKIDTKNLPSGMYIIRVLGSQSIYTGKIVVNSKF